MVIICTEEAMQAFVDSEAARILAEIEEEVIERLKRKHENKSHDIHIYQRQHNEQ